MRMWTFCCCCGVWWGVVCEMDCCSCCKWVVRCLLLDAIAWWRCRDVASVGFAVCCVMRGLQHIL